MMTQKEAVFQAVTGFIKNFKNGTAIATDDKKKIVDILIESFKNGEFEIKNEQKELRTYIVGLLNNHLRKDTRLNGGDAYVPANPGSRAGTSDPSVKAMRQLIKTLKEGSAEFNEVQSRIDTAVAAIKAAKASKQIDKDNLPEDLKHLVG